MRRESRRDLCKKSIAPTYVLNARGHNHYVLGNGNAGDPGGCDLDASTTAARTSLRDGQWHHVALVAERKGNATLYVDGKAGPSAAMEAIGDTTSQRRALRIGDRNSSEPDDFEGELDEVRISNIARKFATN